MEPFCKRVPNLPKPFRLSLPLGEGWGEGNPCGRVNMLQQTTEFITETAKGFMAVALITAVMMGGWYLIGVTQWLTAWF